MRRTAMRWNYNDNCGMKNKSYSLRQMRIMNGEKKIIVSFHTKEEEKNQYTFMDGLRCFQYN